MLTCSVHERTMLAAVSGKCLYLACHKLAMSTEQGCTMPSSQPAVCSTTGLSPCRNKRGSSQKFHIVLRVLSQMVKVRGACDKSFSI